MRILNREHFFWIQLNAIRLRNCIFYSKFELISIHNAQSNIFRLKSIWTFVNQYFWKSVSISIHVNPFLFVGLQKRGTKFISSLFVFWVCILTKKRGSPIKPAGVVEDLFSSFLLNSHLTLFKTRKRRRVNWIEIKIY